MADIKINHQTGDIALPQAGGGFRIYKKGEYKFNREANQFAIPDDAGGWQIQEAPADAVVPGTMLPWSTLPTGEEEFDINAGLPGAIIRGLKGPGDAAMGNIPPEEMESRASETAALFAGAPGLVRRAPSTVPARAPVRAPVKAPTIEQLKGAADAGYTAARGAGVEFNAPHVQSMADELLATFRRDGFVDKNHPTIVNAIDRLRDAQNGTVGFSDLVGVREALKSQAGDHTNPTSQRWATLTIKSLDDYLENPRPGSVASGKPELSEGFTGFGHLDGEVGPGAASGAAEARAADAGASFKNANRDYAAAKRAELLAGKQQSALDNAGAANSGINLDNQLRQRVKEILARPKEGRGYTDEEIAFLREIDRGGVSENTLRILGNLTGGGGGLGGIISSLIGANTFGPAGAALPLAGYAAKRGSAAITNSKINRLSESTRKRSALYERMKSAAPMTSKDARAEALLKAIIGYDTAQPWVQEQNALDAAAVRAFMLQGGI